MDKNKIKTEFSIFKDQLSGSNTFHIWAGPCAIASEEQLMACANLVNQEGGSGLRGGIFKLRTDPKDFQGLREKALPILKKIKSQSPLLFVSEITDPRQIDFLNTVVDVYQVGARNMFNYELLKELGRGKTPVLLKRAFSARIEEWLKATDYLVQGGNENIILCERGIRTFETATRNTLDLNAVAYLKKETAFPVFVDPSHGTGTKDLVPPLSKAALAVGADGLLIEIDPHPETALCDAQQALSFEKFKQLMADLRRLSPLFGKQSG